MVLREVRRLHKRRMTQGFVADPAAMVHATLRQQRTAGSGGVFDEKVAREKMETEKMLGWKDGVAGGPAAS